MKEIYNLLNTLKYPRHENCEDFCMLPYLVRNENWQVIIYGAGNKCRLLIQQLKQMNITPKFILDADPQKNGSLIEHIPVKNFNVLRGMCFNKTYACISCRAFENRHDQRLILTNLFELGIKDYAYMGNNGGCFSLIREDWVNYWFSHMEELQNTFELLEDDTSKRIMLEYIRANMTLTKYSLPNLKASDKYFGEGEGKSLYTHLTEECFVNCGSSIGDTIYYYLDREYNFKEIIAIEADKDQYKRLLYYMDLLSEEKRRKISCLKIFLGRDGTNSLDTLLKNKKVTLINTDLEGAEMDLLDGAKKLIQQNRPVLSLCIYHKPSDLTELFEKIKNMVEGYHYYIRKYDSSCGYYHDGYTEVNELVMYAIPDERINR